MESITPGLELDKRIAEEVFAWTICDHSDVQDGIWWKDGYGVHYWPPDFQPSTRIEDAWKIVTELNRRGFYISVDSAMDGTSSVAILQHKVTVDDEIDYLTQSIISADTTPLAICEAALDFIENKRYVNKNK